MSFKINIIHLYSLLGYFLVVLLFPLIWIQGMYLQRVVLRLPTPSDDQFGEISGSYEKLDIMGIGESPMAGVGIQKHSETLTGLTSLHLNKMTGCKINWRVLAENGLTIKNLNKLLFKESPKGKDVIFVAIGGNDVFNLTAPWIWLRHLDNCVKYFFKYKEPPIILFSAVPCVGRFPAIPNPLRMVFSYWESLLQNSLIFFVNSKNNVYLLKERFPDGKEYFLEDGIHPSNLAYKLWSKKLAVLTYELISGKVNK